MNIERVLERNPRALGRFLRQIDDREPGALSHLGRLHAAGGNSKTIGITGIPGAGKSTLTGRLVQHLRAEGASVAVIAIDPSSPFTGGAILGDRIRMRELAGDDNVFIRSLATRGALGGLTRSARDHLTVLDAAGYDYIIVETVGVGQDEVDISHLTETNCVVCVPGTGDGVQALKAGLLEVADIFVVNKADRDGAARLVKELELLLQLEGSQRGGWTVPIVSTVALRGEGVDVLLREIGGHAEHMSASQHGIERARLRARAALTHRLHDELWIRVQSLLGADLDACVERIVAREGHASQYVEEIVQQTLK